MHARGISAIVLSSSPHPFAISQCQPPTVDEILKDTFTGYLSADGDTLHDWAVEGGTIRVTGPQLRPALKAAYDPNMSNWTELISWDEEDGFFVA